jgi:2,3,4,5-tetrahydropyridine-2-carboxylate N-succinyltransferase
MQFRRRWQRWWQAARAGDWATARAINCKYLALMKAHFTEPSPAPVKAVLALLGQDRGAAAAADGSGDRGDAAEAGSAGGRAWAGLIPIQPGPIQLRQTMTTESLEVRIERYFAAGAAAVGDAAAMDAFLELRGALEAGALRSAEPDAAAPTGWRVNAWVKRGILLGFRLGALTEMSGLAPAGKTILSFVDKGTYPARRFTLEDGVRLVPGGSSVRSGAYVARGVVMMPPAYVNAGAYVDEGTMVDSHALVGSCAQIGKRVHLSAAAQIGGVLEPVNASPVIIEDDVLVGGNTGVYEGTIVRTRAVLAAGTILTRGTPVYDVVKGVTLRATAETPLIIPEGAVVVPGSRAVTSGYGKEMGLSVYTPVIVKYRDEKTDLSTALEDLLR